MKKYRNNFIETLCFLLRDEAGTNTAEYVIIASLISIVVITVVAGIGVTMNNEYYSNLQTSMGR